MKILVICQYYYPEPFRITDICEELVKRGHEVMVVTGKPNYPEGKFYKGYEGNDKEDEIVNGVKIHRCPIIPRKKGILYRFLNYYSFPILAKKFVVSKRCLASDGLPFDVVFVYQLSPVMMAEPAIKYKKKVVLYCMDLWPASLASGGIKNNSMIYKFFYKVSKKIYSNMDLIIVKSRLFKEYIKNEFNIIEDKFEYLPEYAEEIFNGIPERKEDGFINLVFAGNIGIAQSVDTILGAAEYFIKKNVRFLIIGGGICLEKMRRLAEERKLSNVTFYGRRPLKEMPNFYSMADAMLITLNNDPILSLTLPAKVQSYMAAGKPIIGAINGEASYVINDAKCGFCGTAENVDELVKNINLFLNSKYKKQIGINAKNYYKKNYEKSNILIKLENILDSYTTKL